MGDAQESPLTDPGSPRFEVGDSHLPAGPSTHSADTPQPTFAGRIKTNVMGLVRELAML